VKRLSQARRRRYFEIAAFRFCRGGASKDFRRGEMPYQIVLVTGGARGIGAQSCEPALRRLRFPSLWTVTPKPARTFTPWDLGQARIEASVRDRGMRRATVGTAESFVDSGYVHLDRALT
jgi:hypothetical protein